MDCVNFLQERLQFILKLYDSASKPFRTTKAKIKEGAYPFVDTRNPEDADEPAFLTEWQEADNSLDVLGQLCLCFVQGSLKAYLEERINEIGRVSGTATPEDLKRRLAAKSGNWFQKYRLLFLEDLKIDWQRSPVPITDLENLKLTRDDITHNVNLKTTYVEQNRQHAGRFPKGLFTDDLWTAMGMSRIIKVDAAKLRKAVEMVLQFCQFLESA
jgi:hypothetical protein